MNNETILLKIELLLLQVELMRLQQRLHYLELEAQLSRLGGG